MISAVRSHGIMTSRSRLGGWVPWKPDKTWGGWVQLNMTSCLK